MKNAWKGLLAASLLLTGCGGNNDDKKIDTNVYIDYIVTGGEYQTLDYLSSWAGVDFKVTAQCVDGLLEYDQYGIIRPSLAESYTTNEDCSVWTFKLREGIPWMKSDKTQYGEEVTADDFVYAAEYILNPVNASNNINSFLDIIEGAREYFAAMEAGENPSFDMVGVKALDKYTVEYTMAGGQGVPYFGSATTYQAYDPLNRNFEKSLERTDTGSSKFGQDKDHILYCGAYILTDYTMETEKTFEANPEYWDKETNVVPTVKVLAYKDQESLYEGFKRGEVSYAPLLSSTAKRLFDEKDPTLIQTDLIGSGMRIIALNNQCLYSEDVNKANSNLNFRKALFHGIDRALYNEVSNPINPESIEGFSFSGSGFCYDDNGTDYTQLGNLKAYQTTQFNMDKALEFKAKAMEELQAEGVTFPLNFIYQYRAGNETTANQARMLKEAVEALGEDFITVELKEYQVWSDVRAAGEYAFTLAGWSPDWGDPLNNLTCLKTNSGTTNYYADPLKAGSSHWNYPEFDQMVEDANKITSINERYEAFANAEAWLLENAYMIPLTHGGGTYEVTSINRYTKVYTAAGTDYLKYKGIVQLDHVVTAEENAQFKAEWEAKRLEAFANK